MSMYFEAGVEYAHKANQVFDEILEKETSADLLQQNYIDREVMLAKAASHFLLQPDTVGFNEQSEVEVLKAAAEAGIKKREFEALREAAGTLFEASVMLQGPVVKLQGANLTSLERVVVPTRLMQRSA